MDVPSYLVGASPITCPGCSTAIAPDSADAKAVADRVRDGKCEIEVNAAQVARARAAATMRDRRIREEQERVAAEERRKTDAPIAPAEIAAIEAEPIAIDEQPKPCAAVALEMETPAETPAIAPQLSAGEASEETPAAEIPAALEAVPLDPPPFFAEEAEPEGHVLEPFYVNGEYAGHVDTERRDAGRVIDELVERVAERAAARETVERAELDAGAGAMDLDAFAAVWLDLREFLDLGTAQGGSAAAVGAWVDVWNAGMQLAGA